MDLKPEAILLGKDRKARLNASELGESSSAPSRDYADAGLPKKHKQWIETSMIHAIGAVKSGEMSANKAAKKFDVPLTTLKDRISERVRHGRNPGPEPYLNQDEESSLAILLVRWSMGKLSKMLFVLLKE